ncbi:MAG: thiamine phosphate synthase [Cyclobacteriaceae bacterium]|nr:thiamine phosphate synthase [Cyclobacteriaceae bacterium]MCH8517024.1 thiamine phosphate synthase [Cyclobacteriaceae bacterium]
MRKLQLILISEEHPKHEQIRVFEDFIEELGGRVHLRFPEVADSHQKEFIESIDPSLRSFFSLHQSHHLAEDYGVGGLHFKRDVHMVQPYMGISSKSMSGNEKKEDLQCYDYTFLSPIYSSISKLNYNPTLKKDEMLTLLKQAKENNINMVALGGVRKQHLQQIYEMGFYGAAMKGSIWELKTTAERIKYIKELKRINECL